MMNAESSPISTTTGGVETTLQGERKRRGLLVFAGLYNFIFIGAFLGWGPMQLLLEEHGSFSSRCTEQEQALNIVCPEQTSALVNVQFYAIISQIISPLLGHIADQYGPHTLAYLMTCCIWSGLSLFLAATKFVDELLYLAFVLLGLGTWMGAILIMNTGLMFAQQNMSRVILILNSLFDSGSVTYLGLKFVGDKGATLVEIVSGYLVLAIVIFGAACYFWAVVEPAAKLQADESTKCSTVHNSSTVPPDMDPEVIRDDVENEIMSTKSNQYEDASEHVVLSNRTAKQQLLSAPFLFLAIYFTVHATSQQFSMTTTRDFLAFLGDDEGGNKYLTLFTLLLPASLIATPFTDFLLQHFGFYGGLQAVNMAALGYLLIRILSNDLNVQVIGFVIFSFYRNFLYGVTFSLIATILAPNVVGKATGFLMCISGVAAFVNIPFSNYAVHHKDGDFREPSLVYAALIIPCFVVSHHIDRAIQKDKETRAQ